MKNKEQTDPAGNINIDHLNKCRERAAQAWCYITTQNEIMNIPLAESFAQILYEDTSKMINLLDSAWGIIANASGGNWDKETPEWQQAASKWRDNFVKIIS